MKKFYSWLQEEVNTKDLNTYLYKSSLKSIKNKNKALHEIDQVVQLLIKENLDLDKVIKSKNLNVNVNKSLNKKTYAYYDPNNQQIVINEAWINHLEKYMAKDHALKLCLSHEIFHVLEENSWHASYKRRQRNILLEVSAIKFSQNYMKLPYHPSVYEYSYGLENELFTEKELIDFLKGR